MHAGGLLQDSALQKQTLQGIRVVAAPKLSAMAQLQTRSFATPAHSTTVFSSTASLLGPPGQANYAAANAVLDAWSSYQKFQGQLNSCLLVTFSVIQLYADGVQYRVYTALPSVPVVELGGNAEVRYLVLPKFLSLIIVPYRVCLQVTVHESSTSVSPKALRNSGFSKDAITRV